MKKCIVCGLVVSDQEIESLELQKYPVHEECFNIFENADEFLDFAEGRLVVKQDDLASFVSFSAPVAKKPIAKKKAAPKAKKAVAKKNKPIAKKKAASKSIGAKDILN